METGISPEQIAALKAKIAKWTGDRAKYRLMVAAIIAVLGYYGVFGMLKTRIQTANVKLQKAKKQAKSAKTLLSQVAQTELFEPRLIICKDASKFEAYLIKILRDVGLKVNQLSKRKLAAVGPYQTATIVLDTEGTFEQLVDFIDRVERGEVLARFDNLRFSRRGEVMTFKCNVFNLQKQPPPEPPKPTPPPGAEEKKPEEKPEEEKPEEEKAQEPKQAAAAEKSGDG